MVWCFDPLGTVQEPRDLSTGPPAEKRTWEGLAKMHACLFKRGLVSF